MFIRKKRQYNNAAFSLTEMLLAVGTLAIGMIFIAGTFLVGIHFTTVATERTIAAVVVDEAFAKIKLYGVDLTPALWPGDPALGLDPNRTLACVDFDDVSYLAPIEFAYPSSPVGQKQYYWSALCRRVYADQANRSVQVTVFVSRKVGSGASCWRRNSDGTLNSVGSPYPIMIPVEVSQTGPDELSIIDNVTDGIDETSFINDGYTIVDGRTGRIYRVLKRPAEKPNTIELDGLWYGGVAGLVWVVPPPIGGGKSPCIAIYQKVMRF